VIKLESQLTPKKANDLNKIQDALYYWDSKSQTYKSFNNEKYKEFIKVNIKI